MLAGGEGVPAPSKETAPPLAKRGQEGMPVLLIHIFCS